jgi:hypothetical protein
MFDDNDENVEIVEIPDSGKHSSTAGGDNVSGVGPSSDP